MLPGFVDPHSQRFMVLAYKPWLLMSFRHPMVVQNTVAKIIEILKASEQDDTKKLFIEKTGWILGLWLRRLAAGTTIQPKQDLDKVSRDKPVLIIHTSGHLSVANSKSPRSGGNYGKNQEPRRWRHTSHAWQPRTEWGP
nr:amidohydrolase family protein [Vibrio vulnificus]